MASRQCLGLLHTLDILYTCRFGNSYTVADQAAPSCTSSCPAGHYCGKQTVSPAPCRGGTYCPEGSASETACPAGTYSPAELATSDKACLDCGLGTFCPEKSKQPQPCYAGTYANESRLSACYACASGTYQTKQNQTECEVCEAGSYCEKQPDSQGALTPTKCAAGTFSNRLDLGNATGCEDCTIGFYCEAGATQPVPCPKGKVGIAPNLVEEAFCITCTGETTSLPGTTSCAFCVEDFYASSLIDGTVAKVQCAPCLEPKDGAECSETTVSGAGGDSLTHGSTSLATVRINPKYWRLGANSTILSMCLESADGSSSCVGGSNAGGEDDYKKGYTGSGYCKAGHTGPLCQVCNTSDFYFDAVEAMECIQCPRVSERLDLPMGLIGGLVATLLMAFTIKRSSFPARFPQRSAGSSSNCLSVHASRRCSERLRGPIAQVKRVVARIRQLEIVPRCKLLFT